MVMCNVLCEMCNVKSRMKKLLALFTICSLCLFNLPQEASAGEVRELSDAELDNLYAGGLNIDLNKVQAQLSAVAAQSNIGALYSQCGDITDSSVTNTNTAIVYNIGNSAVAAQNNIALAVADGGNIDGVTLKNSNWAYVRNQGIDTSGVNGADVSSFGYSGPGLSLILQDFNTSNSSVAMQNNIAAAIALDGDVRNVTIDNTNYADVANLGNSALAVQNNIGLAISRGGSIDNVTINNVNEATVVNTGTGIVGGATVTSLSLTRGGSHYTINTATSTL